MWLGSPSLLPAAVSSVLLNKYATFSVLIPTLAVSVRRLHDTSKSGWWLLIGMIPRVGWLILLYSFVTDSDGDNQYGPYPKG